MSILKVYKPRKFAITGRIIGIKRKPCEVSQIVLRTTSLNSDIRQQREVLTMKCELCKEDKEEGYICLSCHKKVMNSLDETALKYLHDYYELKRKLQNLSPSPNSKTIQSACKNHKCICHNPENSTRPELCCQLCKAD